jgi:hypothetical protein
MAIELIQFGQEMLAYGGQAIDPNRQYPETGIEVFSHSFAGNGTKSNTLTIPPIADFILLELAGVWDDPRFNFNLTFPNSRLLAATAVRGPSVIGSGSFPVPLSIAYAAAGGAQFSWFLENLSGGANTIQVYMIGIRLHATRG